eukprot:221095-Rhodomonas_salina.2
MLLIRPSPGPSPHPMRIDGVGVAMAIPETGLVPRYVMRTECALFGVHWMHTLDAHTDAHAEIILNAHTPSAHTESTLHSECTPKLHTPQPHAAAPPLRSTHRL